MPFDFEHASIAPAATRRYDLGIPTARGAANVILIVRHAGQANAPYWNALFKRLHARAARGTRPQMTPEQVERGRAETAEVFAQTVLVGWDNVTDGGEPREFSPAAALELLTALIQPPPRGRPDLFDALRRFCEDQDEFTASSIDAAELGKR